MSTVLLSEAHACTRALTTSACARLTALSFADADALLAARVEKGEVSETELISLLHPRTRDTLHIVDCAHIRNATNTMITNTIIRSAMIP